jgi:hypothetical protein
VREKYCWLVADKPSEQGIGGSGVFGAGVFGRKKIEWSCFIESGAAWSPPKHALTP